MCVNPLGYKETDMELVTAVQFIGIQNPIEISSDRWMRSISSREHYNCLTKKWSYFAFFHHPNKSAENRSQSVGTAHCSLVNALIMKNMLLNVSLETCYLWVRMSSMGELVWRNQVDCLDHAETWRGTELPGHGENDGKMWASAEGWHTLWFAHAEWG